MLVAPLPGLLACRAAVKRVPAHGVLAGESRVAGIAGVFTDLNVNLTCQRMAQLRTVRRWNLHS